MILNKNMLGNRKMPIKYKRKRGENRAEASAGSVWMALISISRSIITPKLSTKYAEKAEIINMVAKMVRKAKNAVKTEKTNTSSKV